MPDDSRSPDDPMPLTATWLYRAGTRSWLAIGVLLIVAGVLVVTGILSGVVGPFTVAALLAVLCVPVVDRLRTWRVPRSLGSVIVLVALIAVAVWSAWLTVEAVIDQGPEIAGALTGAFNALDDWLAEIDAGIGAPDDAAVGLQNALGAAVGGLASWLSGAVGGLVSNIWTLLIGCVFGGFFLYYLLSDWDRVIGWVGSQLPSRDVPGEEIVAAAVDAVRRYFVGLTLSALVTAVVIGGVALLLGIPLWLTIAIITFVTSYVPYLGAVISGAFATLIALGTEGAQAAVIILVVVLLVQNVLQPVILTNLTSDQLHLHPIVTLAATLIGGTLGGLIGATLAAPAVATAIRVRTLVSESRSRVAETGPDGTVPAVAADGDRPPPVPV